MNVSQFDRGLFRSRVVSIETNQICLTIFSLAVDKRTKNNLYMHWVSVFIIYSSIETFASTELTFGFDRMNSRSKQPSIELTWYQTNDDHWKLEPPDKSNQKPFPSSSKAVISRSKLYDSSANCRQWCSSMHLHKIFRLVNVGETTLM